MLYPMQKNQETFGVPDGAEGWTTMKVEWLENVEKEVERVGKVVITIDSETKQLRKFPDL